jgi:hypothetical protein
MTVREGRVVLTPDDNKPYKVVLEHDGKPDSEHPVSSIREGEELIKEEGATTTQKKPEPDPWNPPPEPTNNR